VAGAITQEVIDVLAVLNALRAAMTPHVLSDYESRSQDDWRFARWGRRTIAAKSSTATAAVAISGLQPIIVRHQGSSLEQALGGAADKLKNTLKRTLGRLKSHQGRTPYAGN